MDLYPAMLTYVSSTGLALEMAVSVVIMQGYFISDKVKKNCSMIIYADDNDNNDDFILELY